MLLDTYKIDYTSSKAKEKNSRKVDPNDKSIALNEESVRKMQERGQQTSWSKMSFTELNTITNTPHTD